MRPEQNIECIRHKNRVYPAGDRVYPARNRVYPASLSSPSCINRVYPAPNRVYPACGGIQQEGWVYTARGVSLSGDFGIITFHSNVRRKLKTIQEINKLFVIFRRIIVVFDGRVYPASILGAAKYTHMEFIRRKSSLCGQSWVYPAKIELIRPLRTRWINSPHGKNCPLNKLHLIECIRQKCSLSGGCR